MRQTYPVLLLTLLATSQARGQFPWQKPVKRDPAEVKRIVGPIAQREPSRDLTIVWVWGIDKLHAKETHEYAWVIDRYVNTLLPQIPRVTVIPSMYFPKRELWEKADLVVFYLWPRGEGWDYDLVDAYQKRGGGLIFIHMALMQGSGEELSKRIGMAWDLPRRPPSLHFPGNAARTISRPSASHPEQPQISHPLRGPAFPRPMIA